MAKRSKLRLLPSYGLAAAIAAITVVAMILLGLATNAASDAAVWPGWLGQIQRHPFMALVVLGALVFLLPVANSLYAQTGSEPSSVEDIEGLEERIHGRLDDIETRQLGSSDHALTRLPPYARQLLAEDGMEADTWRVIASFADEKLDPYRIAREWAASPPAALEELSAIGRLVVAELLLAYGQPAAAVRQIQSSVDLGVISRAYWLFKAAQITWSLEGRDSIDAADFLNKAKAMDPDYPIPMAAALCNEERWMEAAERLADWQGVATWERDAVSMIRAAIAVGQDRIDDAIIVLQDNAEVTEHAGLLLHLAHLLRHRSLTGSGDSRWRDATRSVELSLRARNLRRVWRGDSAEAVAAAAEAAIIADDPQQCWMITRPEPDGRATIREAKDSRVLPAAAIGAALTGRFSRAQELADQTSDGYTKWRVEAEIASSLSSGANRDVAVGAWRRVLDASTTDEDRLRALRALAMEGAADTEASTELRQRHTSAISEIETLQMIMSASGPNVHDVLRPLEVSTPSASVRRAELLRDSDELLKAAEVLVDAMDRWQNPRLLLMAIDCYIDAAAWELAEGHAHRALADGGVWAGRATVLRRLVDIEMALEKWGGVITASRALLEIDETDDDARWSMAFAEFHDGDPKRAWSTLQRIGAVSASTPNRAMFLLELVRRFSPALDVARTALSQLQAFPDNEDVHGAVISVITARVDRTELPEDVGREVTEAWSQFFDRYADSGRFQVFSIQDGENPLAEAEDMLRRQAENFETVVNMVRDQLAPIGILDRVVGKPYAAIFPYRPLGFHRISSPDRTELELEEAIAAAAESQGCFVDASALYTLALIPEIAASLIGIAGNPKMTAAGLRDLVDADDHFGLPSVGTVGFDRKSERIFANEIDMDVRKLQQEQIHRMLSTARTFRRVAHPALVSLGSVDHKREPVWLLGLDAAMHAGAIFWCDDLGLRRLAHASGVETFGTVSLLNLAVQQERIDGRLVEAAMRTLVSNYVVDLPFSEKRLTSIAVEQEWQPRSVATALGRAASWLDARPAISLLLQAIRNAPPSTASSWTYAAFQGLKSASIDSSIAENLTRVASALMSEPWMRPDQICAISEGLHAAVPDIATKIVRVAISEVWSRLTGAHSTEESVLIFMYLIGQLGDRDREFAVSLTLRRSAD